MKGNKKIVFIIVLAVMIPIIVFGIVIGIAAIMNLSSVELSSIENSKRASNAIEEMDKEVEQNINLDELKQYDNTKVTGEQILSEIKKYWSNNDEHLVMYMEESRSFENCLTSYRIKDCKFKEKDNYYDAYYSSEDIFDDSTNNLSEDNKPKIVENINHSFESIDKYTTNSDCIKPSDEYTAKLIKIDSKTVGVMFEKI